MNDVKRFSTLTPTVPSSANGTPPDRQIRLPLTPPATSDPSRAVLPLPLQALVIVYVFDHPNTMTVNFFSFTPEIRLMIYSELLVLSEPIVFVADYVPSPLIRSRRDNLYPALLRINKQTHGEASPLLYANNCFQFPNVCTWAPSPINSAHIAPFLRQIGSYASFIRHICIPFPTLGDYCHESATLHEAHIENLALIRNTCTQIATLELLLQLDHMSYAFSDSLFGTKALDLLNTQLKTISSLKKIIVNFQIYGSEDLSDLTKKMRDRTWTVEVTNPSPKVWISDNERVEFDNKE